MPAESGAKIGDYVVAEMVSCEPEPTAPTTTPLPTAPETSQSQQIAQATIEQTGADPPPRGFLQDHLPSPSRLATIPAGRHRTTILIAPTDLVSHVKGVRVKPQRSVTREVRLAIVRRYLDQRTAWPGVKAFADAESARLLREEGIVYRSQTIETLVSRYLKRWPGSAKTTILLQTLRDQNPRTRSRWYDIGDLSQRLPRTRASYLYVLLSRLRNLGYEIQRCRTSPEEHAERGWKWQYRLWEVS